MHNVCGLGSCSFSLRAAGAAPASYNQDCKRFRPGTMLQPQLIVIYKQSDKPSLPFVTLPIQWDSKWYRLEPMCHLVTVGHIINKVLGQFFDLLLIVIFMTQSVVTSVTDNTSYIVTQSIWSFSGIIRNSRATNPVVLSVTTRVPQYLICK